MSIHLKGRTAALSWDSLTRVPAAKQIRCRHDHIVVEPLAVEHSSILEVVEDIRPVRGVVKAVGPGHYPKRYNHPDKHVRSKMWRSPTFQPTEVKVGDVVELGGADLGGYNFQTFLWGERLHLICTERDVSGVCEDESKVAHIVPQYTLSAPYAIPGITQADIDALA